MRAGITPNELISLLKREHEFEDKAGFIHALTKVIEDKGLAVERVVVPLEENVSRLKDFHKRFTEEKYEFKVGQIVRWKAGMKNRRRPDYNQPVIVVDVLDKPVFDTKEEGAGTPYFREPLDILLGIIDEDNEFIVFHYDSRRFEPYPGTK